MKRVVIGFFLPLFIFVSGGYTQLYAQSTQEEVVFTVHRSFQNHATAQDKIRNVIDPKTVEEEDDQPTSGKKYIDNSLSTSPDLLYNYSVQCLPFSKPYLVDSHSRSYIFFRVFRV